MERIPSSRAAALELAAVAGISPASATRMPGGSNAVWLLEGTGCVLRIAGPDMSSENLTTHLHTASLLVSAGVPFVRPAYNAVLESRGLRGTLWVWERPVGEMSYSLFGEAVRLLHTAGTIALSGVGAPALPDALDSRSLLDSLRSLRSQGLISGEELAVLEPWPSRLAERLDALPPAPATLVHDDLWGKNIIPSARGVVLSDPDGFSWARADYDLAFIRRGVENGTVSPEDARAFEDGYGEKLPDLTTSWTLAYFHRLRWVCLLLRRRPWMPSTRLVLASELPLWCLPEGPRPVV